MFGEKQVILCPALAKCAKLKTPGRKNCLFSAFGKGNNSWLNGACPRLLVNLGCNSDTLISWRLPLTPTTHSPLCEENCLPKNMVERVVQTIRRAQRGQAGYISDYASKKQSMARGEIKWIHISHDRLYQSLLWERVGAHDIARRHCSRVMSDLCAGRGVLRMSTESVNLLSNRRNGDKLFVETFRSNVVGYTGCYHFMKCATSKSQWSHDIKPRKFAYTTTLQQQPSLSYCYGWRGLHTSLCESSPCGFLCMYVIRPTIISQFTKPSESKHCYLTQNGVEAGQSNY